MTVAQGTPSKFDYLLNAMENASQQQMPSEHGYAGHRAKVLDYVTKLERENAALSAQVAAGNVVIECCYEELKKSLGRDIECPAYIPDAIRELAEKSRS